MRAHYHLGETLEWSLSGLFLGALSGALFAGAIGLAIGTIMESVKPTLDGMASGQVMILCAVVAVPGSAIGGACGAASRRRLIGSIGGMIGNLFAVSYPIYSLWRFDDCSLPYSIILIGVSPFLGSILSGALLGSFAKRIICEWERNE